MDFSWSWQFLSLPVYAKPGLAVVIDLTEIEVSIYPHFGVGFGRNSGFGVSMGVVNNYTVPEDYDEHFADINLGLFLGIDHCWDFTRDHTSATKATAITYGSGLNFGLGYDYYWGPL